MDTDGEVVVVVAGEDGLFFFLDGRFREGSGILSVTGGETVTGILLLPQERGLETPGDKLNSDCNLTGSITERQSMTLEVKCRTVDDQQVFTTLALNYDTRYERVSSLATIAGNYDYSEGMVLNIDANGVVFGQDAVTGCVISGQVTITNMAFGLYDIEWGSINCVGQDSVLNGKGFFGLALLDNTVIPEQLIIAVSSDVQDAFISIISFAERL